jgi:BolA protein
MQRKAQIEAILQQDFTPLFIEVLDESHMHSVPEGAESHFKVTLVSEQFATQSLIARHRLVNKALSALLAQGIHALALHTLTPDEWFAKGGAVPQSPPCLGGSKQA